MNDNLTYSVYDESWTATGKYGKAGKLMRRGIETELLRSHFREFTSNFRLCLPGYSTRIIRHIMEGSAPMNAPSILEMGGVYYTVNNGTLKGLSLGVGAYYVGERPLTRVPTNSSIQIPLLT